MKPGRRSAFADRLREFPEYVFSDGGEFGLRGRWREFFAGRIGPGYGGRVIFEIGCFDGDLLMKVAPRFPGVGFVGLDWKYRALHVAAAKVAAGGVANVALLHGRGQEVRQMFADGEVDEIWVFHPDPFAEEHELKHRLVGGRFLADVWEVLRGAGAVFALKTDHEEYYRSARLAVGGMAGRFDLVCVSADFWKDEAARAQTSSKYFAGQTTGFEERFIRRRKPIYYLELAKRVGGR